MILIALLALQADVAPEWKVGVAVANITPAEPVFLTGYANRNKPFQRVAADLFAKALAFEDAKGTKALIVTADVIGFQGFFAELVAKRIELGGGPARAGVLMSASHTHAGPNLGSDPNIGGAKDEENTAKTVAYTKWLENRLVELGLEALGKMQPARLSWGTGVSNVMMNRRQFTEKGVILGVNPRGPVDRSLPMLKIEAPDGKLRAVLFQCACHGTTLGGDCYEVNGDYMGFAQGEIERALGAPALFMAGCGGDANPYPRGTMDLAREHGAAVAKEVLRVLAAGKMLPVRGPLGLAFDRAELPFVPLPALPELQKLAKEGPGAQRGVWKALAEAVEKGEKPRESYAAPFSVWQFGQDLTLVAMSGEVVVDYVQLVEKAVGPLKLWIAAYCHDVYGYLPSARVLEEGGYETRGVYYGPPGIFSPAAQDVAVRKIADLAAKAKSLTK